MAIYFNRLETVPFSVFSLVREIRHIEYTGCGNTEHRGRKEESCPDCHLAQISWRKGVGEHVFAL
jgi:hypothetical protein